MGSQALLLAKEQCNNKIWSCPLPTVKELTFIPARLFIGISNSLFKEPNKSLFHLWSMNHYMKVT